MGPICILWVVFKVCCSTDVHNVANFEILREWRITKFFLAVLISIVSAIAKIAYPAARGWMGPFRRGLVQNVALWNYRIGMWHLFKATWPLLLGTVLEYGEWELLTLFVRRLGPAEG